jgi:uncharacterized membrane protein
VTLASSAPRGTVAPQGAETSLGLSRKHAILLAYSAGWVSGVLVLWLEARDRQTRRHAAQAVLGFGALTLVGVLLLAVAMVGLFSSLALFRIGLWAAQGLVVVALAFWVWLLARVAFGGDPHWPGLARRAARLAGDS